MSNVLIAIVVLLITFVLMGLGVYESVEASRRSSLAMTVGSKLSRLATENKELQLELGRSMYSAGEEASTGRAYYDSDSLSREAFGSVTFRFHEDSNGYFACATSTDVGRISQEAFRMVAKDRPPSFVSGACGEQSTAIGSNVVVSMRLN